MNAVRLGGKETQRKGAGRTVLRLVMRIVMPLLMVSFAVYTVTNGGLQGLVALLPILAAHIVGFLVLYPLWIRYRRRRATTTAEVPDGN
ncbi:MAG: hypothetical protein V3S01_10260 [Dehalococcoidia bacterium]